MSIAKGYRHSLVSKLLMSVGIILLITLSVWGYFNLSFFKKKTMGDVSGNLDRLSNTIRLGLHYAMMINSRDDIKQIINNIARQNDIENIRIYNKEGEIKYSNDPDEIDNRTNIKDEACHICHKSEPPIIKVDLEERVRIFPSPQGYRSMGIISPVFNEQGCSTDACHVHPPDKKVLGALDLVISLKQVDHEIGGYQITLTLMVAGIFISTAAMIIFIIMRFVTRPVGLLIKGARRIETGDYETRVQINQQDEMHELAKAINQMGRAIGEKTTALNRQRDQYQNLFEMVPCIITVQNRDYRLIGFNREFADKFAPCIGDHCYKIYKGRNTKCDDCPVEKTFLDGKSHDSEEMGIDKDGTAKHWFVRTSPITDENGRIVAAMEMNLDITERKQLEQRLAQSEKKYHAIFNNIPNPVLVLHPKTLEILDHNNSVTAVYGYSGNELIGKTFLDLFWDPNIPGLEVYIRTTNVIERAKHRNKEGLQRFVTIRISPSAYGGIQVLLVTISDITKRLEAEQQLIQASKMATLGEMATGVAHELNQPLSVIKTASNFFMRKIQKKEPIEENILFTMSDEIDRHVQRAAKIINHMRQFGRKSDEVILQSVQINEVLQQAFEIFSQQLKVRGIEIDWEIDPDLPKIAGDAGRLEQVLINLLINARDAIEERCATAPHNPRPKKITLRTSRQEQTVVIEICDTGTGIPETYLEKIFEPFFTTKKVGQGTGLGLSISYGIIQECHGRISARPNPEGGACFVLEFPIPMEP
jgi:histidine kinase